MRSLVVVPSVATDWPLTHMVLLTHAVAGSLSLSQVPAAQGSEGDVPPAQNAPALQAAQVGGIVIEPAAVCTVPAAQAVSGKHIVWFAPEVYVVLEQVVQLWLLVALPAVETKVPWVQVVQGLQVFAPATLNEPLAQPAQVRSAVALPGVASNSPAPQLRRAMQVPPLLNCPSAQTTPASSLGVTLPPPPHEKNDSVTRKKPAKRRER